MLVIELLLDGISFGLMLSLLGVGITLIFGLGEILNLAHGEFVVICTILALIFMSGGMDVFLSIVLSLVITGLIGVAFERLLLFPVYRERGEVRILMGIFMTYGLSLAIHSYLVNTFPKVHFSVRLPYRELIIGGLSVRPSTLLAAIIATSALILLGLFLKRTYVGKAVRTVAQNEVGAQLCGVNPANLRTLIFALGTAMAGLAGILYGLIATVTATLGLDFTTFAIIVAIAGGVRSVYGAIVSGIILGIVHAFSSFFFGASLSLVIFLIAVILIVLARPEGVLGEKS